MKYRFAIGLAAALMLPSVSVAAGPCASGKGVRCAPPQQTVNFLSVPNISKEIVLAEPVAPPGKKAAPQDPNSNFYTGPFIGANRNERAPTIGFHWSIN